MRTGKCQRKTKETAIYLELELEGDGIAQVHTGIGFFDHMITLFAFHSGFHIQLNAVGDLEVDDHHTIEDIGICLGQAFSQALGEKTGIARYGTSYVPMDETLARAVIDISGRPYLTFKANFTHERVGTMDTQMVKEFFKAFTNEARLTVHIEIIDGENDHHKVEAIFKSFGRALKEAVQVVSTKIPSTKGSI